MRASSLLVNLARSRPPQDKSGFEIVTGSDPRGLLQARDFQRFQKANRQVVSRIFVCSLARWSNFCCHSER